MYPRISVVISTYNPNSAMLERTLDALAAQTMDARDWELVLIDNASTRALELGETARKFKNVRIIREERLGLTYGRLAGIRNSQGGILVFVDDDNALAEDYLETASRIFSLGKELGVAGGTMEPEWWDGEPEPWAYESVLEFTRRNFGKSELIAHPAAYQNSLPNFAPVGAGMVARRAALEGWIDQAESTSVIGRRGTELTSCEDTDIVIEAFHAGWSVGYFPELKLTHLIPTRRMQFGYLSRAFYEHNRSWVQLLHEHRIGDVAPVAPWTVIPRKMRAYLRCRAWAGPRQYLLWRKSCGVFDGRVAIYGKNIGNASKEVERS
jgi:GT2 family glycosyltransferase